MINYWNYLKLENLLSLQTGIDDREELLLDDEMFFILVHQVSELWFKLVLRELRLARDRLILQDLSERDVRFVIDHIARASDALVVASDHLKLLSRLSTQKFLELRDKLFPASGFQSFQFAEIEIIMGFEEALIAAGRTPRTLTHIRTASEQSDYGSSVWHRVESARCEVTLRKAIADWFYAFPVYAATPATMGDSSVISDFISNYMRRIDAYYENQIEQLSVASNANLSSIRASFGAVADRGRNFLFALDLPEDERRYRQRVRAALLFVEAYPDRADVAVSRELVTSTLELEQSMQRWRFNHARAVERIIGRRVGTGGSHGVDYLEENMTYRIFDDLWTVRTQILPVKFVPPGL